MRLTKSITGALVFTLVCLFVITGCGADPAAEPTATHSAELRLGREVFKDNCAICHAITPDTVLRGPSLHNIAIIASDRVPNQDARTYIFNSIMRPGDFVVEGFDELMPTTLAKDLTGEELDAVVAYLLTFKE